MKRFGFFTFFSFLMALTFLKAVDDEGAGGGGDDIDDLLDADLDDHINPKDPPKDPPKDEPSDEGKKKDEPPEPDPVVEEMKQQHILNGFEKEFKKEYPDFDMGKVVEKLKEMDKENPGSGSDLFNKKGIELVHLKYFNDAGDGEMDGNAGRGTKNPSTDELIGKINRGEATDSEREAFFAKYA